LRELLKRYRGHRKNKVGLDLERLYFYRCKADYEDEIEGLSDTTTAALGAARAVVGNLALLR
jgi:hypothetical protein